MKGFARFTDEQGNEEEIKFSHKETVNTSNFKEKKKNRKEDSDDELSKADLRKIRKEKKRDLKLEEASK